MPSSRPNPYRRRPSLTLEDLACVALFCFFAIQGAIPFIAPAESLEMTGSAPTGFSTIGGIASQTVANTVILALILRRPRLLIRQIAAIPWLLLPALLAALAIVSAGWSLDPLLTLRRSVPFALAGLFGVWFATCYSPARQFAILRLTMIALAVATVALVILDPSLGLDHTPGHTADWQGVFTQKNACGRIMVLATAVLLFEPEVGRWRLRRLAALVLFLFVLIMSGSRGAWLIEAAVGLLWVLFRLSPHIGQRLRLVVGVLAPIGAIAVGIGVAFGFHNLALVLGRDPTLTGRTAIWAQVAQFIQQRPLFGYGYAAFWRGMQGPSFQVASSVHFVVAHAHNGFLEIALELGAAGLLLFILSWMRGCFALWPLWRRGSLTPIAWPLVLLVLIAVYDVDENTLFIYNGLFWPLYVSALVMIERTRQPALSKLRAERDAGRMGDPHHTATLAPHEILNSGPLKTAPPAQAVQDLP